MGAEDGKAEVMRAAVYRGLGELEVTQLPVPQVGPGEALVQVSFCGICGTDLHNVLDGWGIADAVGGHEWSGRVVAVGDGASLRTGEMVIGGPDPGCGQCPHCLAERPNLCEERGAIGTERFHGAFAQYLAADASKLIPIPEGLDPRLAAYTEPLAVALHAVTVGEVSEGQEAMVFGAGPIGLGVAAILVEAGNSVRVVEPSSTRRELAKRVGATVLEPDELTTSWYPGDVPADAVDVVFEASGVKAAFESGLAQLRRGGRLVQVGNGLDYPTLDTNRMILNELNVTAAFNYDVDGFERAIELIGSGRLPLDVLIEPGVRRLDDLLEAMQDLRSGAAAGKVMVQP